MNALRYVSSPITIVPAYGRTYATTGKLLEAWEAGKDFMVYGGQYCSIRDLPRLRDEASSVILRAGVRSDVWVKVA